MSSFKPVTQASEAEYQELLQLLKDAQDFEHDVEIVEKEMLRLKAGTQKLLDNQHLLGVLHHISKFP